MPAFKINKKYKRLKVILALSTIFILNIAFSFTNLSQTLIKTDLDNKETDIKRDDLEIQQLDSDNIYTGIGDPWNVSHWINRTDNNLGSSFNEGSYDLVELPLKTGWEGYRLDANIKNLYDERNWCNGTFDFGAPWDGQIIGENDSAGSIISDNSFQNWTFHSVDVGYTPNTMSGNYLGGAGDGYFELYMRNSTAYIPGTGASTDWWHHYDNGDKAMWNSSIHIERGDLIECTIKFDVRAVNTLTAEAFFIVVYINNLKVYSISTLEIDSMFSGGWGTVTAPINLWSNQTIVFPNILNNTSEIPISIALEALGSNTWFDPDPREDYQEVHFDNLELITKAEVKPDQIGLKLNGTSVNTVDWGEGKLDISPSGNEWQSFSNKTYLNFSSTDTGVLGTYSVDLDMDSTFYVSKNAYETTYETILTSIGTSFFVGNNSLVKWQFFDSIQVPSGYAEQTLEINFPTDIDITGVYDPQFPSINIISQCVTSTRGTILIPIINISSTPDGFWKIEAESPNYCEDLNFYVNGGSWVKNDTIMAGETMNIRANISTSNAYVDISSYIPQTTAHLQIRLPNGTIWTAQDQWISPNSQGLVNFTQFTIPDTQSPYYIAGEYEAIVTWNNSYSSYDLNETGVIYKHFTVVHDSLLTADQNQYVFEDIIEDSTINLKVSFKDNVNSESIEDADVYTYGLPFPSGQMQNFSEISPGFYFLEYSTTGANLGNNTITIYANSSSFMNNKINITLEVIKETQLVLNSTILSVPWNENFSIELNYTEKFGGLGVQATINHDWVGAIDVINPTLGIYILTANTSLYAINDLHSLNLLVYNETFVNQTVEVVIEIKERETLFQEIKLNETLTNSLAYPIEELLNISVRYTDVLSGQLIDTNTIELRKGILKIGDFNKELNSYNISINTTQLELGGNTLSIYANKDNYSSISQDIIITVNERDTFLEIELNNTASGTFSYYNLTIGETLNLTVWYRDGLETNNPNIIGANVNLTGVGSPKDLDYQGAYDHYNITLNATELGQGVKFLTINADRINYSIATEVVKLNIIERKSNLTLFINGTSYLEGMKYQAELGEYINITIKYIDNETSNHISGAAVDLVDEDSLSEQVALLQYNITLLSKNLGQGVNLFTLIAQKQNYQTQTINFFIEIIESNTTLELFLEGQNKTVEQSIEVIIGDTVNVTILYKDEANTFIPNATVQISGEGVSLTNLTQNILLEQYNITINTNSLGKGVNILTLTAGKTNYQQHTIKIKIVISDKPTGFQLFLNQENKTRDTYYELSLGKTLNVTLFYFDNETKAHLDNSIIQIKYEGITLGNFTEFSQQYTIMLNASDLDNIGLNFFTIYAQKSNYESLSPQIRINVKRILGQVTTSGGANTISTLVGEVIKLEIILNNLDFPGRIYNASVEYTWELGEGTLFDSDNDGIYEGVLENLPSGTYTITITVDAGQNYDFDRFYITLIVRTPEEDVTLIIILIGVAISASIGLTGYLIYYQRVLKYPKPVRKVRNFRKNIKKKQFADKAEIQDREVAFNDLYLQALGPVGKFIKVKPEDSKLKGEVLDKSLIIDKYKKLEGGGEQE